MKSLDLPLYMDYNECISDASIFYILTKIGLYIMFFALKLICTFSIAFEKLLYKYSVT